MALPSSPIAQAQHPPRLSRREWSPIQLGSLGRSGRISWPASTGSSVQQLATALRTVAAHEPSLLLPHEDPTWRDRADGPAKLLALAQLCAEGRRVVWMPPAGVLPRCQEALVWISERNLAVKLIVDVQELPSLTPPTAISRWWVAASGDACEAEAVLMQQLAHEDPSVLALAQESALTPAWDRAQAWYPGSGRVLVEGAALVVVCCASAVSSAWQAQRLLAEEGLAVALWQCTSLCPLPWAALRALQASARPLVVLDDGAPSGFAQAVDAALGTPLPHARTVQQLVQAVRQACRGA
jgi:hypothetical protein